jgi:nitrogen fixation protein NifU and related proteins
MGEAVFDFLNDHSEQFIRMALSYNRQEAVTNPDGYGKNTGDCGDTVEFFLTVRNDRVEFISYGVNGCINTNACANTVVNMADGKPVDALWKITPDRIIRYLKTLPPESIHCAELAVGALYRALANYQDMKINPWKKGYRSDGGCQ